MCVLRKDHLRVSRRGGAYRPEFIGPDRESLAGRLIGVYQGHVGESRATLDEAIEALERDADDFKLVRGLAALLDREATFETRAAVDPVRARRAVFEAAEARGGVVTTDERTATLAAVADGFGVAVEDLADSLYADRDLRQVLVEFDPRWDPASLVDQYNHSLAQTALFDATEVRVQSSDPRAVVSAVKRLGLMYEVYQVDEPSVPTTERSDRETDESGYHGDFESRPDRDAASAGRDAETDTAAAHGDPDPLSGTAAESVPATGRPRERELVVTGPDALFRRSRRYGTTFARLLRTVAGTREWRVSATIDDRGTERELVLTDADVTVPGVDPVVEPTYDSGVERRFAARFQALDLDWSLRREPAALATGTRVMIPDFALEWTGSTTPFRVYLEVMGFWTPEYVEKKLAQIDDLEAVELVVAVDESLGVGEELQARDARVVTYDGDVRVKDVVDVLRTYEDALLADAAADLPSRVRLEREVVDIESVADEYGVTVDAIETAAVEFPDHERVGRTLVTPAVLDELQATLAVGMDYEAVSELLADHGIADESALLSRLGYRIEWRGLSGGVLRERDAA